MIPGPLTPMPFESVDTRSIHHWKGERPLSLVGAYCTGAAMVRVTKERGRSVKPLTCDRAAI